MSSATPLAVDTCDDVLSTLGQYNLTTAEGLALARSYLKSFPGARPRDLLYHLVEQGLLTRFQADTVLRGAGNNLVLSCYSIVDVLGAGSMGKVYKATSSRDSGWYAVRTIPRRNVMNLQSIAEKVEALKQVRHPRVSAMVHVGAQGERVYMVWPLLEGGDRLDELVRRQGKLSARQSAQVALQVASGLQAYHAAGLFHGLLAPSDILIGSDRRVRLLDFGVGFLLTCERGKSLLSTMTNGKAMNHGLECASPESIADPLARTVFGDQYSLGCILYFCLTGRFPFPSTNPVKKMLGHQFEEPTPLGELAPETPPRLVTIVQRLMKKQPQERYSSIDELIPELQVITSGGRGSQGPSPGPMSRLDVSSPEPPCDRDEAFEETSRGRRAPGKATPQQEEEAPPAPSGESSSMGLWLTLVGLASGVLSGVVVWLMKHG